MSTQQDLVLTEICQPVSLDMLRTAQQESLCMRLALDLLACGAARIERLGPTNSANQLVEFCFHGIRYPHRLGGSWVPLITNIGIAECRAHLPKL